MRSLISFIALVGFCVASITVISGDLEDTISVTVLFLLLIAVLAIGYAIYAMVRVYRER